MGDLGVSRSRYSAKSQPSTALARIADNAPGFLQKAGSTIARIDQKLDQVPVVGFVTPQKPSSSERLAAGIMTAVYGAGAGVSVIPWVGSWTAAGLIALGGIAARRYSPNPEVQNQGNLALQTSTYAAAAGIVGLGSIPYARACVKSALIALNKG